jgi:hypothetical protein
MLEGMLEGTSVLVEVEDVEMVLAKVPLLEGTSVLIVEHISSLSFEWTSKKWDCSLKRSLSILLSNIT